MHVTTRSNRAAESAGDFVIAKINMRATSWADCRCRCAADLLFAVAVETLDNRAALPIPKILKSLKDGGILWRGRLFFFMQLQAGFRCTGRKIMTNLGTDRPLDLGIHHLLEAP